MGEVPLYVYARFAWATSVIMSRTSGRKVQFPSVAVYLGSQVSWARALFRSKVDEVVPRSELGNVRIVGQPQQGRFAWATSVIMSRTWGRKVYTRYIRMLGFRIKVYWMQQGAQLDRLFSS